VSARGGILGVDRTTRQEATVANPVQLAMSNPVAG
jgi:hypothetical protein